MPRLSATLIARNEERVIGDCLRSLAGIADEIVVVDTGSADRTPRIAAEFGARVFHFPWCDDFSAARNHAIDHATGDWILYIDADERVRPIDPAARAAMFADPAAVALRVRFHPRTGHTAYPEHRLFRRHPRIRFTGVVHETMLPDVQRVMDADGMHIGACGLTIDHIGYDGPQLHKSDRYLTLLAAQLKAAPARIYLWWHLGAVHHELGHHDEAEAAWRCGIALAREADPPRSDATLCHCDLARMLIARGETPLALIEEGLAMAPGNHTLRGLRAMLLAGIGEYATAAAIFTELAAIDPETLLSDWSFDKRLFGAPSWAAAADCAFRAGDYAAAAHAYAQAERTGGGALEYRVKRAAAQHRAAATQHRAAATQHRAAAR
jgi:hypothetical protein